MTIKVSDVSQKINIKEGAKSFNLWPLAAVPSSKNEIDRMITRCATDRSLFFYRTVIDSMPAVGKPLSIVLTSYGTKATGCYPFLRRLPVEAVDDFSEMGNGWFYFKAKTGVPYILESIPTN